MTIDLSKVKLTSAHDVDTSALGATSVSFISKIHRILPASLRRPLGKVLRKVWPSLSPSLIAKINRQPKMSRESVHKFFRQRSPSGNAPEQYLDPVCRSKALAELIGDLPHGSRILEVGCNVGRNLAWLHGLGYTRLEGIEISSHAVALLRRSFPSLEQVPVHEGPAEEVLTKLEGPFSGLQRSLQRL